MCEAHRALTVLYVRYMRTHHYYSLYNLKLKPLIMFINVCIYHTIVANVITSLIKQNEIVCKQTLSSSMAGENGPRA